MSIEKTAFEQRFKESEEVSPVLLMKSITGRALADTVSSLGKTARRSLWLEQRLSRHRKAGQGPQQQDAPGSWKDFSVFFLF